MYYVVRKDLILEFQHCESTLIDKDAMALKVFLLVIFLINFVKYTCLRRKNSKTTIFWEEENKLCVLSE